MGSKLIAAASGTVVATGYEYAGGRYIMIDHKGGVSTRYYHLSEIHVSEGQWVERGRADRLTGMSARPSPARICTLKCASRTQTASPKRRTRSIM